MSTYYAAQLTNSFINTVQLNLRNLNSADLEPFYDGPNMPDADVAGALTAANAHQVAANLTAVPESDFRRQTFGKDSNFFRTFLGAAGFETEYEDDFIAGSSVELVPELGPRSAYISKNSGAANLSIAKIRDSIRNQSGSATADHLVEPTLPVLAESDPYVRVRIKNMREYINRYFKV